jgi:uncharacterized membrane protein YgcG
MTRIMSVSRRPLGALGLSTILLVVGPLACTTEPKVEDQVPAPPGATQPASSSSATTGVDEACDRLRAAEDATRSRLDCAEPDNVVSCPEYLRVAGATQCDEVLEDTVAACVATVEGYSSCNEFNSRPCIVTVEPDSCRAPAPPISTDGGDAGPGGAGGSGGAGGTGGAGGMDASSGGAPLDGGGGTSAGGSDASDPGPLPDGGEPLDASMDATADVVTD